MVKNLPHAPIGVAKETMTNGVDLSQYLATLDISSNGYTPSATSSESGETEVGGPQVSQAKAPVGKYNKRNRVKRHRKAAEKAAKAAAEEAERKAKKEAEKAAKLEADKKIKEGSRSAAGNNTALYDNVIDYFDATYERLEDRLAAWQLLCVHVGIDPELSITKCKEALSKVFINIVDFVASQKGGPPFKRFESAGELRRYIRKGKVFPLGLAKDSPCLRCLLINVFFK
ncbi:hypothetical protein LTR56_008127 [Elasticomyces elasticus]|nr:hypothetical protein LTR56_008127 [Elasticomyces elasticus]KAK3662879.1 hypothetical protein LTR22_006282 [Elasticomyces elasticus]KAK4930074.1 hypothetical protein LTR49_003402 [Elasticomyces elasticus]KAK5763544.1 hypothetical protein LTS12_006315 [Elasticomyces elasticus]